MNLPKLTTSEVFKWVGGIVSILAIISAMVWGVPSYLEAQVSNLYGAEVKAAGPSQEVKTLIAKVEAVEAGLIRVEARGEATGVKVDDFSIRFIAYLERQAERNQ
jgi:hypothetical protein